MQQDGSSVTARERVAQRIRHAMVRRRGVPGDLLNVAALDERFAAPATDHAELEALEADVQGLHGTWNVAELDLAASPRRFFGPLLARFRRVAQGSLPLFLQRQADFNASSARAISTLRNQTIRQDTVLEQIRESVTHVLKPAMERQVAGLLELERVIRTLETELAALRAPTLDVDQASLMERFRGTEAEIRERQQRYVEHFREHEDVLDLGCGRGEFLELLAEAGIGARGVDSDSQMVERCREKGLDVEQRDALGALDVAEPGTLGGIFAAQLIEHLEPASAAGLVRRAFEVLRPGGVLLLETPNPRSLVALSSFFVDPTHERPYDPELVCWLLEDAGFADVRVEYSLAPEDNAVGGRAGEDAADALAPAVERLNARVFAPQAYAAVASKPSGPARGR